MKKLSVRRMTELSLLMAIVLLMGFTPLGYLPTPWGLHVTLIVIPVAVGGIVLGPKAGTFLGLVFGLTSFFKTFGSAGMGPVMLEANPVGFFVLCVAPRILAGLLPALLYHWLSRFQKLRTLGQAVCCFLTPICNTVFYMTALWLLFADTWLNFNGASGSGFSLLWLMISGVAVNGIAEAVACLIIGTAVSKALIKFTNQDG